MLVNTCVWKNCFSFKIVHMKTHLYFDFCISDSHHVKNVKGYFESSLYSLTLSTDCRGVTLELELHWSYNSKAAEVVVVSIFKSRL